MPNPPHVAVRCCCTSCRPIVILSDAELDQLDAIAVLIHEIDPDRAEGLTARDHLAFALDLAAEQATDFRHRLARLNPKSFTMI